VVTAPVTLGERPSPSRSVSAGWQPTTQVVPGSTPSDRASMNARSGVA
jgi:hypothetical protein